ncbi:peptide chain release factor N(5)-glutamine methyltransferase [Pseudomonas sp. WAC2]|uniref:peptide chain release factor N(5)-glutamine methyltransferase n=1 Tax=Pseudomonas sp. WAC2 TaxID=3055057 RepID=UPI0025B1675D|nr:peptide chain release factor N(5)-glutamine methyltransferase [Pseudomonas sp. WAC2]MDN3236002.1 peptide chain release factor N(5)-glutamine methyltransferase [Pseudomonas sp. WAC2]
MATIGALLKEARLPDSPSERLDAELLLAAALGKPRSFLRTWPERIVTREAKDLYSTFIERRRDGEPIAYILGHQGFWSLDLEVSPDTLIPRPDTELLVETALALTSAEHRRVLDLGTGTGAIALALAHERAQWQVIGVDRVDGAVVLAERNRARLGISNASFQQSHWFAALSAERFDIIVSNPPYIPHNDPHLDEGDVRYEPASALVAGDDGLDDIRLIVQQAPEHLLPSGWLLLEHGFDQAPAVRSLLTEQGFISVESHRDLGGHERVTLGQRPC